LDYNINGCCVSYVGFYVNAQRTFLGALFKKRPEDQCMDVSNTMTSFTEKVYVNTYSYPT